MTDLASSGTAQEARLADRERRKVVVQHEPPRGFAFNKVQPLGVGRGPQRDRDQGLGLTPREDGRAVGPR